MHSYCIFFYLLNKIESYQWQISKTQSFTTNLTNS